MRARERRRVLEHQLKPLPWHVQRPFDTVPHVAKSDALKRTLSIAPQANFPLAAMLGDPLASKVCALFWGFFGVVLFDRALSYRGKWFKSHRVARLDRRGKVAKRRRCKAYAL